MGIGDALFNPTGILNEAEKRIDILKQALVPKMEEMIRQQQITNEHLATIIRLIPKGKK